MILVLLSFAACLVVTLFIGRLWGEGRGWKRCDASWEVEWDRRKDWLAQSRPTLTEHAAPVVTRRHPVSIEPRPVVEPVRTELIGDRQVGRHRVDNEPTGVIPREIPRPPGEITELINRIFDEADRSVVP